MQIRSDVPWDLLRDFLAVARAGSLSAAGRALGVPHTTVARRLRSLEEALGSPLFLRGARGLRPTRLGQKLVAGAERVEAEMERLGRLALDASAELEGPVRLATSDLLAAELLAPRLPWLAERFPRIVLELVAGALPASLSRREADVALRLGRPADERLVGKKLCEVGFALYASSAWPRRRRRAFRKQPLLAFDPLEAQLPQEGWLQAALPGRQIALRANRFHTLWAATRAGLGAALLPCFIAAPDAKLVEVGGSAFRTARELWLLSHAEVKDAPRVRAVRDWVAEAVRLRERDLRGR